MKLFEVTNPTMSPELVEYLTELNIRDAMLSPSGRVIVKGAVSLQTSATSIKYPFESVSGSFDCADTKLTSFKGAPRVVGGSFYGSGVRVKSLAGAPHSVGKMFDCATTNITSLKHAPQDVGGFFCCHNTEITTLEYAPKQVGGGFDCAHTNITSLEHAPNTVNWVDCRGTAITSLKGIHKTNRDWKVGGVLYLPNGCADIVGLAMIKGITRVQIDDVAFDISDHDPHAFQEKLLDAGMKAQARM